MKIGLIDLDGKLPNLALMKISTFHKSKGDTVVLNDFKADKLYCSVVFQRNRKNAEMLKELYPNMVIGGTGWELSIKLPPEIHAMQPDYELYTAEKIYQNICGGIGKKESKIRKAETIANSGMGFTSRGCIRNCGFCIVPKSEGKFRQENEIGDLLNTKSNILILNDNNLTADPYCIDKLHEIRDRKLIVDINQGVDIRLLTDEIAVALAGVKHLRSIHYAWDLMAFEKQVLEGINILSKFIKPYRHMCFMLTGFNTTFEEDMYRFHKLRELGIDPYVMVYNEKPDIRLKHFERWVNGRIYKVCKFNDYEPWEKAREQQVMFT
ncbi:radical SAM protein [Desulfitobacterium sp. AusDCA]|uniref:radical SAM protein n=1 Tax=Desulfitobacterium sp. AusDCA TaxID=3240383 RepID=UPI003DA7480D